MKIITIIKYLALSALVLMLMACSTVTIHPERLPHLVSKPDFEESRNFYFWGLEGHHKVDVTKICGPDNVRQMQTQMTFEDGLFTVITFGIYSPHTIKVWCKSTNEVNG